MPSYLCHHQEQSREVIAISPWLFSPFISCISCCKFNLVSFYLLSKLKWGKDLLLTIPTLNITYASTPWYYDFKSYMWNKLRFFPPILLIFFGIYYQICLHLFVALIFMCNIYFFFWLFERLIGCKGNGKWWWW